jgi:broad specificity phosphatase PhoE
VLAVQLGQYLRELFASRGIPPEKVRFVSSTAVRAVDTAKIAMKELSFDERRLVTTDELLELDMGEFAGKPRAEIYNEERMKIIQADVWNFAPPGGESQKQVEERIGRYVEHLKEGENEGVVTCIVFHGLAIKCLLRSILGSTPSMTRKIETENCSISHVAYCKSTGWHVKAIAFDVLYSR